MLLDIIKRQGPNGNTPQPPTPTPAATEPPAAPVARNEKSQIISPKLTSTPRTDVLESGVEIKGSLKSAHDLHFDGRIEGEIHSAGNLTVGENAIIKGGIKTRSVVIFGNVEGNIAVQERCELRSTAHVAGDITSGSLTMAEGAAFMGQSKVGQQGGFKASAPVAPAPERFAA